MLSHFPHRACSRLPIAHAPRVPFRDRACAFPNRSGFGMNGAEPDPDADTGGREAAGAGARLTEDLILEILKRLPAKSLHRFRCVSRQWRGLISDPKHRTKLAQALAGFVYIGYSTDGGCGSRQLHFTSAGPDDGPPPPVDPTAISIPPSFRIRNRIYRVDCSNGLILLRFWMPAPEGHRYAVCNPATDEWAFVPLSPNRGAASFTRLAVTDDPASSSPLHFRIFQFRASRSTYRSELESAEIYSSETGAWTHRECLWDVGVGISVRDETSGVFFRGALYLAPIEPVIASVDGEGNSWRTSRKPSRPDDSGFLGGREPGFIGVSQGRLQFLNTMERDDLRLCNWELDDGGFWVMKHTVDLRQVFTGRGEFRFGFKFSIIGIHPDCNTVYFLQGKDNTLISCAMYRAEAEGRVIRDLGRNNFRPYIQYVPLFSPPLAIRALED